MDASDPQGKFSTMIVSGRATQEEYDQAVSSMRDHDAVLERCPKCDALLDISGCEPMTETMCPDCGALIKVLREFHLFTLLSVLGRGGAGTVFRAFDQTLERDVALKLLRNEHTRDPAYIEALEREALITASINHQHVVRVFSTGSKNGFYYIAMEIVGGGSLAEKLSRLGPLSEADALDIAIQLAEGLQAANERGMLHRDVKPGNVLFASHDLAKVSDFGLATPVDQAADDSGDIWGTPEYIAPEKLLRQGEDVRSDIYSFGCTLFHCLTGTPPLNAAAVRLVIETQRAHAAPNVRQLAPHVSGPTAFLLARCLQASPSARYQNYDELLEHLHYAQDQLGKATQPATPGAPIQSAHGSMQKVWVSAAASVLAVLVLAGAYLASRPKAPTGETASERASRSAPVAADTAPTPREAAATPAIASVSPANAPARISAVAPATDEFASLAPKPDGKILLVYNAKSLQIAETRGAEARQLNGEKPNDVGGVILDAKNTEESMTFLIQNVPQGTFEVHVGVKTGPGMGMWIASGGRSDNKILKDLGPAQDSYTVNEGRAELLAGQWGIGAPSDKWLRFVVTGKNTKSAGYSVVVNYIKLIKVD